MRPLNKFLSLAAALACAAGAAQAQVYTVSPALPIPAGAPGVTFGEMTPSELVVSGGPASIGLMKLTLNLTHTYVGDLDIFLAPPGGGSYLKLTSDNGGTGENFTGTIFVDTATASIITIPGTGGYTGEWLPEGTAFDAAVFDGWGGASPLPANFVSSFAGFAGTNANGTWTLFLNDDAGGDIGTLNSWSLEFVNPSNLNGTGTATNAGVCPAGGSTLITVRAFPGANPASTGITGRVDLSSVGGSATQALFDNGTNGDVTANDNIFSYRYSMPSTQPTGAQSVTWTLRDAQNRTATGSAAFNVSCLAFQDTCEAATFVFGPGTYEFNTAGFANELGTDGACTGFGAVSPDGFLRYRATATREARIATCGLSTADTVLEVYDACGGVSIACDDDTCDPGTQSEIFLPVTAGTEYLIRVLAYGNTAIAGQVSITESGSRLSTTLEVADPANACDPLLLTATVTPGQDPASTGITVTADLSDWGGDAAAQMFDNGTNGDVTAGDNIFTLSAPAIQQVGFWFTEVTVTDNEARTATADAFFETTAGDCLLAITLAEATPDPVVELQPVLLTVTVAPALNAPSTGITVTGDLTDLGGSATQQFFDDGTNGDVTANDNIFSFTAIADVPDGFVFVDVTANDAQARIAEDTIVFAITGTPSGACCLGSSCQILRQAQCTAQGGNFAGANTNCGGSSYEASTSTSAFVAINTTGTNLGIAGDDVGATITLPFPFNYSGTAQTEVYANSNGLLSFGGVNSNAYVNAPFPTVAVPNNIIGVLWDDLEVDTVTNPISGVYYQEFGSAPNRTFVISWEGIPQLAQTDNNNFQAVFTEGSNNILFRYGTITAGIDANAGAEDATGGVGVNIAVADLGAGDTAVLLTAANIPSACDGNTGCGSIDFNGDTLFPTDEDLIDFFSVLAGGPCSTGTCGSIDFNGDGLFPSDDDLVTFLRVLAGGLC